MKAIILLFDSLNKNYLPPYGDLLTKAPNFQRWRHMPPPLTIVMSAVCPVCQPVGNCTPGAITFCIVSGGRWNPLMIPCRNY